MPTARPKLLTCVIQEMGKAVECCWARGLRALYIWGWEELARKSPSQSRITFRRFVYANAITQGYQKLGVGSQNVTGKGILYARTRNTVRRSRRFRPRRGGNPKRVGRGGGEGEAAGPSPPIHSFTPNRRAGPCASRRASSSRHHPAAGQCSRCPRSRCRPSHRGRTWYLRRRRAGR